MLLPPCWSSICGADLAGGEGQVGECGRAARRVVWLRVCFRAGRSAALRVCISCRPARTSSYPVQVGGENTDLETERFTPLCTSASQMNPAPPSAYQAQLHSKEKNPPSCELRSHLDLPVGVAGEASGEVGGWEKENKGWGLEVW